MYEVVVENPYLEDYYKDIGRWSFNMEVFFLKQRFIELLNIANKHYEIIRNYPMQGFGLRFKIVFSC